MQSPFARPRDARRCSDANGQRPHGRQRQEILRQKGAGQKGSGKWRPESVGREPRRRQERQPSFGPKKPRRVETVRSRRRRAANATSRAATGPARGRPMASPGDAKVRASPTHRAAIVPLPPTASGRNDFKPREADEAGGPRSERSSHEGPRPQRKPFEKREGPRNLWRAARRSSDCCGGGGGRRKALRPSCA